MSSFDGMLSADRFDEPMMTDEIKKAAGEARASREDRLKSALRENLKRRKVQARERGRALDPAHDDESSSQEGPAGKPMDRLGNE